MTVFDDIEAAQSKRVKLMHHRTERIKSEFPLSHQVSRATRSSALPDEKRRFNALCGLPPDYDESGAPPRNREQSIYKPMKVRGSNGMHEIDKLLKAEKPVSRQSASMGLSELLNNFDPVLGGDAHPTKAKSSTPQAQRMASVILQSVEPDSWTDRRPSRPPKRRVIDLTDEGETGNLRGTAKRIKQEPSSCSPPAQIVDSRSAAQAPSGPLVLNAQELKSSENTSMHKDILDEYKNTYAKAGILLPDNVATWKQMKQFAVKVPIETLHISVVEQAQLKACHARTQATHLELGQRTVLRPRASNSAPNGGTNSPPIRDALDDDHQIRSISSRVKTEDETLVQEEQSSAVAPRPHSAQRLSLVDRLLSGLPFLDTCSDLLPPNAPDDHPHLVQIWDDALLDGAFDETSHLSLPDTIVSILYQHSPEKRDTLRAFIEHQSVHHFFFLFRSRSGKAHSWSIEREGMTVTIGIERGVRAENDTSQAPSTGHADLSVKYDLIENSAFATCAFNHRSSLFPADPTPLDFLFHTPANHGARMHTTVQTTAIFPFIRPPADSIGALARYLQHTAFKVSVIQADIQVAYGRKVRYDKVIGGIRAVYPYALRGAQTQRMKRNAGLYNRPQTASRSQEGQSIERGTGENGGGEGAAVDKGKAKKGTVRKASEVDDDSLFVNDSDDEWSGEV